MPWNELDQPGRRVLLRYFRFEAVVAVALAAFIVVVALAVGDVFSLLVGLGVAALAYVGYRAYADNA